jgi:hypothetical protein
MHATKKERVNNTQCDKKNVETNFLSAKNSPTFRTRLRLFDYAKRNKLIYMKIKRAFKIAVELKFNITIC